jgi:hypothetical protein
LNYKTGGPLRESTFKKGDDFLRINLVSINEYCQGVKSAVLIGFVIKRVTTLSVFLYILELVYFTLSRGM